MKPNLITHEKLIQRPYSELADNAKGIGIILVVIGHYHVPNVQPEYWLSIRDVIYTFHMQLFMLISGYLFNFSKLEVNSINTYAKLLKNKFQRLLYPYITVAVLISVAKYLTSVFYMLPLPFNHNDIWKIISLCPVDTYAMLLWFLSTLFLIFALYPLLISIFRNNIILLIVAIMLSLFQWPRVFCFDKVIKYLPYFVLGIIVSRYIPFKEVRLRRQIIYMVICAIVFYAVYSKVLHGLPMKINYVLLAMTGSLFCMFLASIIACLKKLQLLKLLGVYAVSIYLFHTLAMAPFEIIFFDFMKFKSPFFIYSVFIVCTLGLLIPLLIEKYLLKPNPILLKYFLGTKKSTHG